MAIIDNGVEKYRGQVFGTSEHYWMDGMLEEYAHVWDMEKHESKSITVGYYGCDGRNLYGDVRVEVDLTEEVKRDIRRTLKARACEAFAKSVVAYKSEIRKGSHVEVIRGRKVKKGTKLEVFWVGEKETYKSRQYSWMREFETIAGCYDEDGNKVWIKAEYLKVTDNIKSPNAKERAKFIKNYVDENAKYYRV